MQESGSPLQLSGSETGSGHMLPEWGRETEEGVRQIMTSGVTSAAAERLQSSSQEGKEENV